MSTLCSKLIAESHKYVQPHPKREEGWRLNKKSVPAGQGCLSCRIWQMPLIEIRQDHAQEEAIPFVAASKANEELL